MSNARKKLVDIIRDQPDETVKLADAIIAALPGLVKPLEWRDCAEYSTCLTDSDYSIKYWAKEKLWVDRYTTMRRNDTLEAAKAAAQAHYVAQIMAAFGIDAGAMREGKDA